MGKVCGIEFDPKYVLLNFIQEEYRGYLEADDEEKDVLDKCLEKYIDALVEEKYKLGREFQKQKDKQKMEDIIDDAENFCGRDGCIDGMCIGICSECDECCKSYFGLKKGMEKYFE